MPHLHDEDKADNDDVSACSKSIETGGGGSDAICPATESAANKLLSLAAMAEEHAKSSIAEPPPQAPQQEEEEEEEAAVEAPPQGAPPQQDETEPPPQLVEGHPPSPSIAHLVARPPPFVDDGGRQQLPPPSPGMGGPRSWGGVVSHHHPRFHGFVRPGVMHRVYPGPPPPPPGPMAGSPVPMGEHPVRYMRRGAPARGGFPMWTASPRPPYRPPPSPLPPAFRNAMSVQPYTMTRQCSSNDDDSSSVNSGRAPVLKRVASAGYPTKSILKKARVETPTTAACSSESSSNPTSEEDTTRESTAEHYTLSKTVSASTDAGVDNADSEMQTKTTIESVVVEKSSFSSEDVMVKRQRIISPASSNEYQKSEHDEEFAYTQEGSLSPDHRGRIMSHEAAAAAGSPGPHYRLAPPFHLAHPPPPVQGMHCGPPGRRGPYMPPGPMYSHHGMRPFPPMAMPAVTGPPGMYPPRNMSSRGRPAFAGMPPFYARPRMEACSSPSSVTPEQPRPKHMLDKAPQPPVSASSVTNTISRRQSGTPTSVGGMESGDASGSANRCIPLTPPVPSKYWSDADTTKDIILPDFHRLVNFPDLLVKGRNVAGEGGSDSGSPNALSGKKRCVMCGQLRVSATYVRSKKANAEEAATDSSSTPAGIANNGGSSHIIPRQNKGVCTACDVTVWVALELDGLEIKWCKGCKNFRPWSHFGDKSLATKCLRCRDRQKEKYAMQKSASRRRSSTSSVEEKKTDDHPCSLAVVAANGLRDLMNATR